MGKWLGILTTLALVPRALALDAPPPAVAPVTSKKVAQSLAFLDKLAAELAPLVVHADATPDDLAALRQIHGQFEQVMRVRRPEGAALHNSLNLDEKIVVDAYAQRRVTPLVARLVGLLEHAQAAATLADPLLDNLVEGRAVLWSALEHAVAFCDRWDQEGMGRGAQVVFQRGKEDGVPLPLFAPEDDEPTATLNRNIPALLHKLKSGQYAPMLRQTWTGKKPLKLAGSDWQLKWQGRRIWGQRPRQKPVELALVTVEAVWKVTPLAVYTLPGVPVAVVALEHDPGKLYGEGLNHVIAHEAFLLSEPATATVK